MVTGSLVAVFLAFVIVFSVGMRTSIIGDSMERTLFNGQEILVNRVIYKLSTPKRGDVIVFLPNGNQNSHLYVKRVVGLPGETVQITRTASLFDQPHALLFRRHMEPCFTDYVILLYAADIAGTAVLTAVAVIPQHKKLIHGKRHLISPIWRTRRRISCGWNILEAGDFMCWRSMPEAARDCARSTAWSGKPVRRSLSGTEGGGSRTVRCARS